MMAYQSVLILVSALILLHTWDNGISVFVHATDDANTTEVALKEPVKPIAIKSRDIVLRNIRKTNEEISEISENLSALMKKVDRLETEMNAESNQTHKVLNKFSECDEVRNPEGFLNQALPSLANYKCICQGEVMLNVSGKATKFYCDMKQGGLVIHRRFDGSVSFDRYWNDYAHGFGSMKGEFWLGLDLIHEITASGRYKIRIDLEDFNQNKAWAEYDDFKVNSASDNYRLTRLGNFNGNIDDRFNYHLNMQFSTKDRDNDKDGSQSYCAPKWRSGWWYKHCHLCNLNYPWGESQIGQWYGWSNRIAKSQMKLIPMN